MRSGPFVYDLLIGAFSRLSSRLSSSLCCSVLHYWEADSAVAEQHPASPSAVRPAGSTAEVPAVVAADTKAAAGEAQPPAVAAVAAPACSATEAQLPVVAAEAALVCSVAEARLRVVAAEPGMADSVTEELPAVGAVAVPVDPAADCSPAAAALHLDAGSAVSVQTPAGSVVEADSAADWAAAVPGSWVAGY
jgi:hypothetical protein